LFKFIGRLHGGFFGFFQRNLQEWLPGFLARLVFAGVLFMYFFNSAKTKVGEGLEGLFTLQDGAFAQILPTLMEKHSYDVSAIPFIPYHLIVYAGTYAEFILPVLIVPILPLTMQMLRLSVPGLMVLPLLPFLIRERSGCLSLCICLSTVPVRFHWITCLPADVQTGCKY